ncbi:MAG TPA: TRAP transporter large permease [Casimicrobiaceae bacterium]|nr:TRAP transporter large permease [Casimicrobiaceae bacterium]
MSMLVFVAVFAACIMLGVPLVFALAIPSLVYLLGAHNTPLAAIAQQMYSAADSFPLLAIPFFLLAGELMSRAQITDRIAAFSNRAVGWIRGGLGQANVLASMLLAGISGSAVADSVAIGKVMIASMEREGFERDDAAALTAAASVMGPIIPPSIPMVIFGAALNQPIGTLFAAGFLPGLLVGLGLMVVVYLRCRNNPAINHYPFSVSALARATLHALIPLSMPVLLVGGILGGVFTPTEAGAVASLYAAIVGLLVFRSLTLRDLWESLVSAAIGTCVVMLIVIASNPFGWVLSVNQVPQAIAGFFNTTTTSPLVFLLLVNIALLIAGMFMETTANILILGPILFPAAVAIGIDPVHFSMIFIVNLVIGLITPPVGLCLFSTAAVASLPLGRLVARIGPYLAVELVVLALITLFPSIVLVVPRALGML